MHDRKQNNQSVCAVYPLLPDPTDFIRRLREFFPAAQITFYTANAEAAKRAASLGLAEIHTVPLTAVSSLPPTKLRSKHFDAVVVAVESSQFRHYQMFLVQLLFWRGVRRYLLLDNRLMPIKKQVGGILRLLLTDMTPMAVAAVLLHLFWLIALPVVLPLGWLRGRRKADTQRLLRHTRRMLTSPLAYLVVHPQRLPAELYAATRVLIDFTRKPTPPGETSSRKLLLIRLDHIGDLVLNTAQLAALKQGDEPWEITQVIGPWTQAVVGADPRIDRVIIYPSSDPHVLRQKLDRQARTQRRQVRRELAGQTFDLVVDPGIGADSTSLLYLPRARRRATMHMNRWFAHGLAEVVDFPEQQTEIERIAKIFRTVGVDLKPELPRLYIDDNAAAKAEELHAQLLGGKHFVAVHPGASWPGKRWPIDRFVRLAHLIHKTYALTPLAFFVPGEEYLRDAFVAGTADIGGNAVLGESLATVFALLARADAFIGNDSGLMHASAALSVPTLGIFGPSDVHRWQPCGKQAQAVSLHLRCSPCYMSYCTDPRCIKEMPVDQVWQAFAKMMGNQDNTSTSA